MTDSSVKLIGNPLMIAFWLFLIVLGVAFTSILMSLAELWEKSRGRSVRYSYLIGLGALLMTLFLNLIIQLPSKEMTITNWDFTDETHYPYLIPVLWNNFVLITCVYLGLRFIWVSLSIIIRDRQITSFQHSTDLNDGAKVVFLDILKSILLYSSFMFMSFWATLVSLDFPIHLVLLWCVFLILIILAANLLRGEYKENKTQGDQIVDLKSSID